MENHILIGLGGTGYNVLKEFRKRLWAEYPDMTERHKLPIRFLYVDSDERQTPKKLAGRDELRVGGQDTAIKEDEYLDIKNNVNLNNILDNISGYPTLRHVVQNAEFIRTCLGEVGDAAGQKRRAGRILFAANADKFNGKITHIIHDVTHASGNSRDLNIYVFAGLAGGTGSGSIVDAVSQIITNHPNARVEVFAMLPEKIAPEGADAGRYHANGYAAIAELSALNAGVFLPTDVGTGAPHIPEDPNGSNKRFGLTVYTNENRNGAIVNSFEVLPKLLADVVYFRVMNEGSQAMSKLNRFFRSENRPDFLVEYKTNTKPGTPPEPARSKAFGSFGIKRLRYPSDRMSLHASENVSRTIMGMMTYLNYDNDRGYINERPTQSRDYAEYLNKSNLKNWSLSDADLSLSVPVLRPANGKTQPTFADFWHQEVALDYGHDAAKEMGHPLQIVEQYFDERYRDEFRDEKGVEAYFQGKANPQVVKDTANAIVDKIQTNLFNQWQQGQYSALDVRLITEQILTMLQTKNRMIDNEITALENDIDASVKLRAKKTEEYKGVGLIGIFLTKKRENIYAEYTNILADEYVARTRRASLQIFQKALLPRLIQQFTDLQADIQKFTGRLDESFKDYGTLIGENTPASEPDLRDAMIEVADLGRLNEFEHELLLDRQKMDTMAQAFRNHIAVGLGNSFDKLTIRLNSPSKLESASVEVLDELIQSYHSEMMRNKPALGLNVLEQLYEMYGHDDDALGNFATTLVNNSEVYITLNDQEVKRNMPNTESPVQTAAAGPNTILLVAIPNLDTDDEEKKEFVEKLKIKIKQAYNASDTRIFEMYESPVADEITILTYQNIFPARAIDYMPFLKQKYEKLVKSGNDTTDKANKILLHSEGDGSALPPLFGEGDGPKGDDLIKYIFLAAAFGILREGEDEMGRKGWGSVSTNFFGIETFSLLSQKFTGILTAEGFTPEIKNALIEDVEAKLSEPRHVNANAAATELIKGAVKNYVFPEAGSPTSPLFNKYAEKAMSAIEALTYIIHTPVLSA